MKKLKKYAGRVVALRPERFARLMAYAQLQGAALDNRFLVAAGSGKDEGAPAKTMKRHDRGNIRADS